MYALPGKLGNMRGTKKHLSTASTSVEHRGSRNTALRAARAASAPEACQRACTCSAYANEGKNATTPCAAARVP